MFKIILAVTVVLVVAFSFISCEREPSVQEIVDGVIESFDDIKTYQFDLDMTMYTAGEVESEATEHTVTMANNGTLDLENQQMEADMSAGSDDEMMRLEMYIVDGMMYARPEAPGEEPMWIKEEVSAERWEMMKGASGLDNYKELLETAQVEVIGNEKVKGVDCYVLKLTPELAELYQVAMNPVGGIGRAGMLSPVPEELLEDMFRSFSVKQWIAKDTNFLMKAEIDMVIETTPELKDYLGEEVDVSVDITLIFLVYNYNKPVSIELHPEAVESTQ